MFAIFCLYIRMPTTIFNDASWKLFRKKDTENPWYWNLRTQSPYVTERTKSRISDVARAQKRQLLWHLYVVQEIDGIWLVPVLTRRWQPSDMSGLVVSLRYFEKYNDTELSTCSLIDGLSWPKQRVNHICVPTTCTVASLLRHHYLLLNCLHSFWYFVGVHLHLHSVYKFKIKGSWNWNQRGK